MIRFSHTLFALPFAGVGALAAARGLPSGRVLLGILGAMVGARSAAMAVNRLADEAYDRANPRTAGRHLPAGLLTRGYVRGFSVLSAALFLASSAWLNPLCLRLSPVALAWILGYSYAKRFTSASHLWLGVALGMAPVGAWAAVTGTLSAPAPWWLGAAVMAWVAGFDVLYALQDLAFDRLTGLHSLPAKLGVRGALAVARLLHAVALGLLAAFVHAAGLGVASWVAAGGMGLFLLWEHRLVKPDDLSRLDTAFFTMNAAAGLLMAAGVAADVLCR